MKQKTGMDAARELFAAGSRTKLIFLSSSTDFLRQSYSVRAVYYLVKPIVPEEFEQAMQFLELQPDYAVPFLEIVQENVPRSIPTERILFFFFDCHNRLSAFGVIGTRLSQHGGLPYPCVTIAFRLLG